MFQSATLKLTGWYLLILLSISIVFSLAIYNIASREVNDRLLQLQAKIEDEGAFFNTTIPSRLDYVALRNAQNQEANRNLAMQLFYANLVILLAGGAGSYFLARRTLRPIEEAHETQARFVSDASHELKTPLTVMKAELELALRDKNLSANDIKEILESNLEEVNKLSTLSTTLLQLSQFDHTSLEKEEVSLNKITSRVTKKYDKTGKRITFSESTHELPVYGHPASIEELITILVDNALKYSPNDSQIVVTTKAVNNRMRFTITNSGEGIASEDLPYIFDRFYRADTARTKNKTTSGHGLGLSLAKRIVELHEGELSATSAAGHDTTFSVELPTIPSKS